MTHDELAVLRDAKDWNKLWPEAQTRADFSIEQVANGATDKDGAQYDPDIVQVGHEAAWIALQDWEPIAYALDTHIKMRVQGAVRKHQQEMQTGGIGSRRTVDDGNAAEHVSMATEVGYDEEGGDVPTYADELTYGDTDNVPEGYGSPEQELARETTADAIAYYMNGLTEAEAHLAQRVMTGEVSQPEYALEIDVDQATVSRRLLRLTNKMHRKSKTWLVLDKAVADWKGLQSHFPVRRRYPQFWSDAEGMFTANPIWSEATGRVWASWEWKPSLTDVPNLTVLRKHERAANKRAA